MKNFLTDFKASKDEKSRKRVVRNVASRNMWRILDHFKKLPTDEDFRNLSNEQTDWIIMNMNLDIEEQRKASRGISPNEDFEDFDTDWVHEKEDAFNPLKEGHDESDIAKQVDSLSSKDYLDKIKDKFSSLQEWQEYLDEHKDEHNVIKADQERRLQENLDKAYEEARKRESGEIVPEEETVSQEEVAPITNESAKDAIDLFNGSDDSNNEDDDVIWF